MDTCGTMSAASVTNHLNQIGKDRHGRQPVNKSQVRVQAGNSVPRSEQKNGLLIDMGNWDAGNDDASWRLAYRGFARPRMLVGSWGGQAEAWQAEIIES